MIQLVSEGQIRALGESLKTWSTSALDLALEISERARTKLVANSLLFQLPIRPFDFGRDSTKRIDVGAALSS